MRGQMKPDSYSTSDSCLSLALWCEVTFYCRFSFDTFGFTLCPADQQPGFWNGETSTCLQNQMEDLQLSGNFCISSCICSIAWLTVLRGAPEVSSDTTLTPDQSFVCGCVDSPGNVCKTGKTVSWWEGKEREKDSSQSHAARTLTWTLLRSEHTWRSTHDNCSNFSLQIRGALIHPPWESARSPQTAWAGSVPCSSSSAPSAPPPAPSGGSELCARLHAGSARSPVESAEPSVPQVSVAAWLSH